MTKLKHLAMRLVIKDQDLIKDFAIAKSKLSMDGKIHDHNTTYAEYCIKAYTKIILEEY